MIRPEPRGNGRASSVERRSLGRVTVAVIVALAAFLLVGVAVFGGLGFRETHALTELAWIQPTAQAFMIVSALAIAILCFGRYQALGGAWVLWTGAVFVVNAVLGVFYLLAWPGLIGDRGVIARLPNTSSWLFMWTFGAMTLLLVTVRARRPERLSSAGTAGLYAVAAAVAVLIGLVTALLENSLPLLLDRGAYTPLASVWTWVWIALLALAAVFAYRGYATGGDAMLGYATLFLVLLAFGLQINVTGGKRYDVWWYASRVAYDSAYLVVLFGFLQEGYALFGAERERSAERERLLGQIERLAQAARLRAAELEVIVESIADAVFVCDATGRISLVNAAGLNLMGAPTKESLPTLTSYLARLQLRYPGGRPVALDELAITQALEGQVIRGREQVATHPATGRRVDLLVSTAPLRDEEGNVTGAVEVATDITRIRELTEIAQTRAAELDHANKELEAFAYSVSHDLRAPLRHIEGFGEIILKEYAHKLDDRGKEYLRFLREGSRKMEELIDALLKLSRVSRAEMHRQPVDLTELVRLVGADLAKEQPWRQVELIVAPDVQTDGDPQLLRIAVENLVANAWKFTAKRPVARIEFGTIEQDGETVYYVRDNGAGFEMAYADKLFGPFQRLHSAGEFAGTGIGLATVQRIIHRHGGRVWGEGEVDRGATFYFALRG